MKARRTPWRDNIEAVVGAILIVVTFKYFLLEFYQIPSPSMQPTLYGTPAPLNLHDRILADKLSYKFRDPRRFEVSIFRYPLDRARNFVKRVWGLPGEDLRIENGDVWVRASPDEPWRIPRRPSGVMGAHWKRLLRDPLSQASRWSVEPQLGGVRPAWRLEGGDSQRIEARGDGRARFEPQGGEGIVDDYRDGYPPALAARVVSSRDSRHNAVGDLRLSGRVRALEGCRALTIVLSEGAWRHHLTLPGPAAEAGIHARLESVHGSREAPAETRSASADGTRRLQAGRWLDFEAENLDDRLTLRLDGEELVTLEVAPVAHQLSAVSLELEGEGADLERLAVWRDIYYGGGRSGPEWSVPESSYFMLGDNTQDSSDSRDWQVAHLAWLDSTGQTREARGNMRPQQNGQPVDASTNPVRSRATREAELVFFRDVWGEPHVFAADHERPPEGAEPVAVAPFVPRELVTGRAIASIWPISPSLGVWRPKWVR